MGIGPVIAYFIFNHREARLVKMIIDELGSRGILAYWSQDRSASQASQAFNAENFQSAGVLCVLVSDGELDAADYQLLVTAKEWHKPIVPILLGEAPSKAFEQIADLVSGQPPFYIGSLGESDSIEGLAERIRQAAAGDPVQPGKPLGENDEDSQDEGDDSNSPAWLIEIIEALVHRPDEARARTIEQIQTLTPPDREALGEPLRSEIKRRFAPVGRAKGQWSDEAAKSQTSARSWLLSALLWADHENEESEKLFLEQVSASYEPEAYVRFWVLAGLYQRRSRILHKAAAECAEDPSGDVRALSYAAQSEDPSYTSGRFRPMLLSEEYEPAWGALRALRIVPIQELLPDICEIIVAKRPDVLYDAIYAASNPLLAPDAATRLAISPGIEETVRTVVSVVSTRDRNVARNFAILLAEFDDEDRLRKALQAQFDDSTASATARTLLEFVNEWLEKENDPDEISIAGYSSDFIDDGTKLDDSLGIEEDVKTLTAVMLAQDVQAPLAIGLFGDWGSGKSYFMQSMYAEVEQLKAKGAPELFRKDVCQIRFNAWHYVDTNLWASLVSTILEQLAAHVSPEKSPEEKEAALISELGTAQEIKKEAEAEKVSAQAQLTEKQGELQKLQLKREQKEIELTDLRISDLAVIFQDEPELKKELEKSLKDLGVPAAVDSVSDLSHVLVEANSLRSRAISFALSIFQGKNVLLIVIALLLMLYVIPQYGPRVLRLFSANNSVDWLADLLGKVTVALGSVTVVLRTAVSKLKGGFERVEKAKLAIDKRIAEKRQNPSEDENKLQNDIAELKAREVEASSHLDAAAAKVVALEEQIRAINEGRSLAKFLAERTNSEDYRKHLGLISTIRKDFDSLAKTLKNPVHTSVAVDRIILYIDDLDRCPENKVMDVLQAVHLLLAYPLFVVVVGVDPRWLLHSLGRTYSQFRVRENTAGGMWRTTPQNYLEKIFQIPFNLNRMTGPGYGKLLDTLMGAAATNGGAGKTNGQGGDAGADSKVVETAGSGKVQVSTGEVPAVDTATVNDTAAQGTTGGENGSVQTPQGNGSVQTSQGNGAQGGTKGKKEFTVRKEALVIHAWEREFAEKLYPLIPTPRAAKRFSNIYRILKARVRREHLASFEGTQDKPGNFQIPMLLLAMLIGSPELCVELFPIISKQSEQDIELAMIFSSLKSNGSTENMQALQGKIMPIISGPDFPNAPWVYVDWIPRVARFSFDVGRAVQAG